MSHFAGEASFSNLIDRLYASALDGSLWRELADDLAAVLDTRSATLQIRNIAASTAEIVARTSGTDDATEAAYKAYYYKHDVWATRALELDKVTVTRGEEIISEADLQKTEIYQDFFRKLGIFRVLGAVLPLSNDQAGLIGVHRSKPEPTFSQTDSDKLTYLLPHFQRALQVRQRLGVSDSTANQKANAFDDKDYGVLLLDRAGRLLYANSEAERVLKKSDALVLNDGVVSTQHVRSAIRLQRLINDAAHTAALRDGVPGGAMSIPRADRFPLALLVAPFQAVLNPAATPIPAALVLIRDPEVQESLNQMLQSLFGLTPAEAKIANALASGSSIEVIAASSNLSHHTVRTQLKSISQKTGTSRQGELIALVLKATAFPKL